MSSSLLTSIVVSSLIRIYVRIYRHFKFFSKILQISQQSLLVDKLFIGLFFVRLLLLNWLHYAFISLFRCWNVLFIL